MGHGQLFEDGLELLTEEACLALAAQQSTGWLALSIGALPAVFPVPFCLAGRDVVVRVSDGPHLDAALRGAVVTLGIDEFDNAGSGWSVLVVGMAAELSPDEVTQLRCQPPADWRTGTSGRLVRIRTEIVSGRRARLP